MRIISGEARGRRLYAPEGMETRPTADRVREALFNIIRADVPGARVLDAFAGSGALALEALSRGADSAVLIDRSPAAVRVIRKNVELMRATGRAEVIAGDCLRVIDRLTGPYTLVFLDPPYALEASYAAVTGKLASRGLLAENALIVMERAKDRVIAGLDERIAVFDERIYRDTALMLARFISAPSPKPSPLGEGGTAAGRDE